MAAALASADGILTVQKQDSKEVVSLQELHERIRVHSMDAGKIVKQDGGENDLLERIANDPAFGVTLDQLKAIMKPELYVGRAPQQTEEFVENYIKPITEKYSDLLGMNVEIKV